MSTLRQSKSHRRCFIIAKGTRSPYVFTCIHMNLYKAINELRYLGYEPITWEYAKGKNLRSYPIKPVKLAKQLNITKSDLRLTPRR